MTFAAGAQRISRRMQRSRGIEGPVPDCAGGGGAISRRGGGGTAGDRGAGRAGGRRALHAGSAGFQPARGRSPRMDASRPEGTPSPGPARCRRSQRDRGLTSIIVDRGQRHACKGKPLGTPQLSEAGGTAYAVRGIPRADRPAVAEPQMTSRLQLFGRTVVTEETTRSPRNLLFARRSSPTRCPRVAFFGAERALAGPR